MNLSPLFRPCHSFLWGRGCAFGIQSPSFEFLGAKSNQNPPPLALPPPLLPSGVSRNGPPFASTTTAIGVQVDPFTLLSPGLPYPLPRVCKIMSWVSPQNICIQTDAHFLALTIFPSTPLGTWRDSRLHKALPDPPPSLSFTKTSGTFS